MEIKPDIIHLNSKKIPLISEVGGKGHSLIKLSSLNLIVPNGIILTVNYFQDWIQTIEKSDLYNEFITHLKQNNLSKEDKACSEMLNKIKSWCIDNLKFDENKKLVIEKNLKWKL